MFYTDSIYQKVVYVIENCDYFIAKQKKSNILIRLLYF
jgi:hypothetical protein